MRKNPDLFVTVTHPELGLAEVPRAAVKHMEPNGWAALPDATPDLPFDRGGINATDPITVENDTGSDEYVLPAKSAPKSDWVAYARQAGIPDPESFTKDDLIAHLTTDNEES